MSSRPRILLIGLPEATGRRLSRELGERGCACEASHGPGDAIFRASWNQPDLVLIDDAAAALVETLLEETHDLVVIGIDDAPAVDALAVLASAAERRRAASVSAGTRRRLRVLVVDDDVDLREALRTNLEESGFDVVEATDGLEALEALDQQRVDVILLDLMMPRLSGIGFLQRVSADSPPIVVHAACLEPSGRDYPNVAAVLRKPAPIDVLLDTLESSALARAS